MTEITTIPHNIPISQEANNIVNAAGEDGGFEQLMKFKKGDYFVGGEPVRLGAQYIAHCIGWNRCWIKFRDQQVVDRKMYPVSQGGHIPLREELDETDRNKWPNGPSGQPSDPWVYQYLLPMEDQETGDICIFVTSSIGGKRAVADLCKAYGRRTARTGKSEQPVIKLAKAMMPTKGFGDVPRPQFDIVGWADDAVEGIREIRNPDTLREEINDDIPF